MSNTSAPDMAAVARALASDARATIALELLDGRAWTLTELARATGTAVSTASGHVDQMVEARILEEVRQGRHRYLRLAGPGVAEAIEGLAALSDRVRPARQTLPAQRADQALRDGRSCYHHLAGRLGVALCDGTRAAGFVTNDWTLSDAGRRWLMELGVDLPPATGRPLLRPCLDWTERREHLAGVAADQLLSAFLIKGWLTRRNGTRAVSLTHAGRMALADLLDPALETLET